MSRSLYEIDDEIERVLLAGTDRDTGDISDECLQELEALEVDRTRKVLSICAYIKGERLEASKVHAVADAVEAQAEKERNRAIVHENRASRLERYLSDRLDPNTKLEDERASVSWRSNPPRVEIEDESKLPTDAWRIVPEWRKPDKKEIAARLKTGRDVPGAKLIHSRRLVIK